MFEETVEGKKQTNKQTQQHQTYRIIRRFSYLRRNMDSFDSPSTTLLGRNSVGVSTKKRTCTCIQMLKSNKTWGVNMLVGVIKQLKNHNEQYYLF